MLRSFLWTNNSILEWYNIHIFLEQHVQGLKIEIIEKTRTSIKPGRLIQRQNSIKFDAFDSFLRLNFRGSPQKMKPPVSFTRVFSAEKFQNLITYLSISEPFSIVDTIVGFFKSQIFQKGIFWVVNQKRSHGHSLLSGDTQAGRLYWAESQQLTINPTASRYKQHFGFRQSHWWTDYFLSYKLNFWWETLLSQILS